MAHDQWQTGPMTTALRRPTWWWIGSTAAGFIALSILVATGTTTAFDQALRAPQLDPRGWAAQIWLTIAIVSHPFIIIALGLVLAIWVARQRLLRLAVAIAVAIVAGPLLQLGLKYVFARPRPESTMAWAIGAGGFAFPSGHVTAITVFATLVVSTRRRLRQGTAMVWLGRVSGSAAIVVVALDRWALSAHWVTDLIGGALFGSFIAAVALALVDRPPKPTEEAAAPAKSPRLAAIVYNPVKVGSIDLFRRQIAATLADEGWAEPLWYETTAKQTGQDQARSALAAGADLVIASGGDGTITAVIQALAHSGTPLAILPSGTANLLARNVGVPLDEPTALAIALTGRPRRLDLVRITTDDYAGYSASISGVGIDAKVMADTTNDSKRFWGNAAYAWSIMANLSGEPHAFQLSVDGGAAIDRRAVSVLIGNIGLLQVPLTLFPKASYDDGIFDVLVATPENFGDWTAIGSQVLAGRPSDLNATSPQPDAPLEYAQARRLVINLDRPTTFEIDGEPLGVTERLVAEIQPEALLVMAPD